MRYDEVGLLDGLGRMASSSRVAFAASCAERLFPAYDDFSTRTGRGDRQRLAAILKQIWEHLLGNKISGDDVRAALSRCMELIPGETDEPWVDEQPYAESAASAIAYTVRTLQTDEPQEAAWAARCAYEAADHHVMHRLGVGESQALAHPVVQGELSRQRRDLEELLIAPQESAELFVRLRDRAKAEASSFFGASS